MDDLDNILFGEETDAPTETEVTQEPETIGQPRDESGRFAPKETGETPQATAEPVEPTAQPLETEEFQGLKNERKRRQEAEERARTLEAQLQSLQQPKEPQAPPPSVWEDETGAFQHFGNEIVTTAVSQSQMLSRVQMSEMLMRQSEPEFDDLKAAYVALEASNPSLIPQVMNDPHPWNKAIQIVKAHQKMEALGAVDVDSLKAKLREEVKAELEAQKPAINLPASLADAQSSRSSAAPQGGPLTLEEILHGKS